MQLQSASQSPFRRGTETILRLYLSLDISQTEKGRDAAYTHIF
ncbi:MAG: hypothetical protein JWL81_1263 [Verrucomicrobiales bacterium]|nr:hypothetical protein [Verrucomicrobiales bacterium]